MVKINVFNQDDYNRLLLKRVVDAYNAEREVKSFSDRHPELGRMVNCAVCNLRHRASRVCVPVYSTELGHLNEQGVRVPSTKRQALGAASFKGRILKHRNAWGLQVLELATILFRFRRASPYMTEISDEVMGKECLSRSLNLKRARRAASRKAKLKISKRSRRVNRP